MVQLGRAGRRGVKLGRMKTQFLTHKLQNLEFYYKLVAKNINISSTNFRLWKIECQDNFSNIPLIGGGGKSRLNQEIISQI